MKRILMAALVLLALLIICIILSEPYPGGNGAFSGAAGDTVLKDESQVRLFGLIEVDSTLAYGFLVTAVLLLVAAVLRVFVIPRFTYVPGKLQLLIETWVGIFERLSRIRFPERIMERARLRRVLALSLVLLAVLVACIVLTEPYSVKHESIREAMRDAVLHDENRISLFGVLEVDPALVSGFIVTGALLLFAALLRIFVIPRFTYVPGRLQLLIEAWVGMFDNLAKSNSPHSYQVLGAYIFAAGSYIFTGTMFELFGFQMITSDGYSVSLPAPLANINGAIAIGGFSYLFILTGGILANRLKGVGRSLKEFSLPVSMTFRLYGALLSGMLTTELVYYYVTLSFVLPVIIGVLFTVLHALIQAYVLTMLTSVYYGEVTE